MRLVVLIVAFTLATSTLSRRLFPHRGGTGRRPLHQPDAPNDRMVIEVCKEFNTENVPCNCNIDDKTGRINVDCTGEQLGHARLKFPNHDKLNDKQVGVVTLVDMNLENLNKADLLPFWSTEVEQLILDDNRIVEIEDDAFDDFESLLILSINDNNLHSFSPLLSPTIAPKLRKLSLMNNKVSELKPKTFQYYSQLVELHLCGNPLEIIDKFAFNGLHRLNILKMNKCGLHAANVPWMQFDKLESLQLRDNRFHTVPFFDQVASLKSLDISENDDITEVTEGSLNRLSSLTKLVINDMYKLWGINANAFRGLHRLEELVINDNPELYYISPEAFGQRPTFTHNKLVVNLQNNVLESWSGSGLNMSNVEQLRLVENPWNCDCNIKWMTTDQVALKIAKEMPVCSSPEDVAGELVTTVEPDSLVCVPTIFSQAKHKITSSAKMIMWALIGVVIFAAFVGAALFKQDRLTCRSIGNGGTSGTRTILGGARNVIARRSYANDPAFDYRSLRSKFGEHVDDDGMPVVEMEDPSEESPRTADNDDSDEQPAFV